MPGISLISNFDVNAPFPIDSRLVVNDITARNNIVWLYEGLKVYVLSERQSYIYQDSTWRVEYNGIYGGSGSLPGNVSVDFGSFSNTVGTTSNYFQYEVDSLGSYTYLQNQFLRHTVASSGQTDAWQGIEFRQQLKYNRGTGLTDSSYISYNPKSVLGGISFGTGDSLTNPVSERMVITGDGKVGISTNAPRGVLQIGSYSTTNELPLVFDIRTARGSSIGYNWYYTSTDFAFDTSKGSSRLSFTTDGFTILNRAAVSLVSTITHSFHVSSTNGNVGIKTLDPKGILQIGTDTTTRKPLVFHNETNATIGYNWYFDVITDNVFDTTKPSFNINFEQTGGLNIKTRPANSSVTAFTSSVFVNSRDNRVGVNTTSPGYTLDVNGVINGRTDIYAGKDIKAGDKIETTNGYFFKNSISKIYNSGSNAISFISTVADVFRMTSTQNISYVNLIVLTSDLIISSGFPFNDNSRRTKGIVFEAGYSSDGSGIYHYQGLQSNADMGISVLSKFNGQDRESLRISEGGRRVQIGVPSNVTIAHNLDTSSQIDTFGDMYSTSRVTVNKQSNLLLSGRYTYTQGFTTIVQRWSRVGSIVHVQLYVYSSSTFYLSNLQIETPITSVQDGYGVWISKIDSTGTEEQGVIRWSSNDSKMIFKDSSGSAGFFTGTKDTYTVFANYTIEIQ